MLLNFLISLLCIEKLICQDKYKKIKLKLKHKNVRSANIGNFV